ncbi:hypothetical protein DL89DRAFT_265615 [Linderina pennispora]|uniref:Uncharacterized protein n=1 Tax=Linderina pennispora TaxID=61395 RepID=A0A1Y1WEJ4_9FUNG|nr:uncharacterized protein DL89DRAFT_265615 [Linderina pennispora]ORX71913.1 hypothetical protein DL89DRAFT_265615 [Linderina pennispora]
MHIIGTIGIQRECISAAWAWQSSVHIYKRQDTPANSSSTNTNQQLLSTQPTSTMNAYATILAIAAVAVASANAQVFWIH